MKIVVFFLFALLLISSVCAEEGSYRTQIKNMCAESENVKILLTSNTMDYTKYDKWHSIFKPLAETFEKDFSSTHKQRKSFQLTRESCDHLSLVWTMLKQAEYADTQYKEFITTGDVGYAHKWKDEASTKRNDAVKKITQAFELLDQAYACAGTE